MPASWSTQQPCLCANCSVSPRFITSFIVIILVIALSKSFPFIGFTYDDSFNQTSQLLIRHDTDHNSHCFCSLRGYFRYTFMDNSSLQIYRFSSLLAARPLGFITDILNLSSPKLEWKQVEQGNIPRDAIKLRPFSSLVHHYCRVSQVWTQKCSAGTNEAWHKHNHTRGTARDQTDQQTISAND